jgi:hypothetical protein
MGISHNVFATDETGNEGLMIDVDGEEGEETFSVSFGRWVSGYRKFGFNAEIGPLNKQEFSDLVDKLIELRNKYK